MLTSLTIGKITAVSFSPGSLIYNINPGEKQCQMITLTSDSEKITLTNKWAENKNIEWKTSLFDKDSSYHRITIEYPQTLSKEQRQVDVCVTPKYSGEYHGILLLTEKQKGNSIIEIGIWLKLNVSGNIQEPVHEKMITTTQTKENEVQENQIQQNNAEQKTSDIQNPGITANVVGNNNFKTGLMGVVIGALIILALFAGIRIYKRNRDPFAVQSAY